MINILTIGAYGFTQKSFIDTLLESGCDALIDTRMRRGVRGREYSWANKQRLECILNDAGILYRYEKNLAPLKYIRDEQTKDDKYAGTEKRKREELGALFKSIYIRDILDPFPLKDWVEEMTLMGIHKPALFCVEKRHLACHRSIISSKLEEIGYSVHHLIP